MPQMTKGQTYAFMTVACVLLISSVILLKTIDPHNDTHMGLTLGMFIGSISLYFMILVFGDIYKK